MSSSSFHHFLPSSAPARSHSSTLSQDDVLVAEDEFNTRTFSGMHPGNQRYHSVLLEHYWKCRDSRWQQESLAEFLSWAVSQFLLMEFGDKRFMIVTPHGSSYPASYDVTRGIVYHDLHRLALMPSRHQQHDQQQQQQQQQRFQAARAATNTQQTHYSHHQSTTTPLQALYAQDAYLRQKQHTSQTVTTPLQALYAQDADLRPPPTSTARHGAAPTYTPNTVQNHPTYQPTAGRHVASKLLATRVRNEASSTRINRNSSHSASSSLTTTTPPPGMQHVGGKLLAIRTRQNNNNSAAENSTTVNHNRTSHFASSQPPMRQAGGKLLAVRARHEDAVDAVGVNLTTINNSTSHFASSQPPMQQVGGKLLAASFRRNETEREQQQQQPSSRPRKRYKRVRDKSTDHQGADSSSSSDDEQPMREKARMAKLREECRLICLGRSLVNKIEQAKELKQPARVKREENVESPRGDSLAEVALFDF